MDVSASNAIAVLRNIDILRQKYCPSQDRDCELGVAVSNPHPGAAGAPFNSARALFIPIQIVERERL